MIFAAPASGCSMRLPPAAVASATMRQLPCALAVAAGYRITVPAVCGSSIGRIVLSFFVVPGAVLKYLTADNTI